MYIPKPWLEVTCELIHVHLSYILQFILLELYEVFDGVAVVNMMVDGHK